MSIFRVPDRPRWPSDCPDGRAARCNDPRVFCVALLLTSALNASTRVRACRLLLDLQRGVLRFDVVEDHVGARLAANSF